MSAGALYDGIARIARHEAAARMGPAVGRVTELHPADAQPRDHAVTVELRDSGLVLPRVPIAVGALGFAAIPAVDDLVLVVFLEGDPNAPVCVGRLYHPELDPPAHAEGELQLALPPGADEPAVAAEIKPAEPAVRLRLPGEVLVEVLEETVRLQVGEIALTVEAAGGGRVAIAAGAAAIEVKQDGDVTVKTGGKLTLEGNEVEIKAQAKVTVSGAEVDIN